MPSSNVLSARREFKKGLLFTTELYLRSDWWIHRLHCRLKAVHVCHCLAVIRPTDHVHNCSSVKTQFVCFTSASFVSDYFFNVSLFSAWITGEVCSLSWGLYQTANRAFCNNVSVPVQSNCGTVARTENWVLCGGSQVAGYQPQLWRWGCCVLKVFSGVHVAAVVWMLNCDNSTKCSVDSSTAQFAVHTVRLPDNILQWRT
jgi:hypothetical protein